MTTEFLIATNGFKGTLPAIEYGARLAALLGIRVTLLGINERPNPAAIDDDHHPLEEIFDKAVKTFEAQNIKYQLEVDNGRAEEAIPRRAAQGDLLVVLAPLGRPPLQRWVTGRSIRELMEDIAQPILYAPRFRQPLKKILICAGGLGYEVTAEHLALQIASKTGAEITLLHVIPPVEFDYPTTRAESENWQNLEESDTPIGRTLREALQAAAQAGVKARVLTRKGNVVEEILSESEEGNYDLLCMGSVYSSHALRQMYAPNVTAEIAEASHCPVLMARYKRES